MEKQFKTMVSILTPKGPLIVNAYADRAELLIHDTKSEPIKIPNEYLDDVIYLLCRAKFAE